MIATLVGALLLVIGLGWSVGEPGNDGQVLFIAPGVVLLIVGLVLESNARTRQGLKQIRVQLEAMNDLRSQPEE
jgi:sulfite exporter TauE/SafE